jgi:hypothetical protein
MAFLSGNCLTEAIREVLSGSDVRCAVAFWGQGADGLFQPVKGARIVCNLLSGGTNPAVIELLVKSGANVKHSDDLHAKVYLSNLGAVVGSANASANGLGLEAGEQAYWVEAGAKLDNTKVVADWFEELWRVSRPISNADIAGAKEVYKKRRAVRPSVSISNYDFGREPAPLMEWLASEPWNVNVARVQNELGYYDDNVGDRLVALSVEDGDRELLQPGRWILSWTPRRDRLPNRRDGLWWWQVRRIIDNAGRPQAAPRGRWQPMVLMAEHPGPEPFSVRDPQFLDLFCNTLRQEEFEPLRREDYPRPWYIKNLGLMGTFWLTLQKSWRKGM